MLYEPLQDNILSYFNQHLYPALLGVRETESPRVEFFKHLTKNVIPLIVLCSVWYIYLKKSLKKVEFDRGIVLCGICCLLIALSGTFPLMISHKFRGFYLVTTLPFYALGFAMLISSCIPKNHKFNCSNKIYNFIQSKYIKIILVSCIVLITGSLFTLINTPRKNKNIYYQLPALIKAIPKDSIIGISEYNRIKSEHYDVFQSSLYDAILYRYLFVSLDSLPNSNYFRKFFFVSQDDPIPYGFENTGLLFDDLLLYKVERVSG